MSKDRSLILETLRRCGTPVQLPGAWARVPCDRAFFQLESIENTAQTLLNAHATDKLVDAGLGVLDAAGQFCLASHFVENRSLLLALHESPDKPPFEVVAGRPLGWRTLLADHAIRARLAERHCRVLVASDMLDLAILRSLGFLAIPLIDLASLSGTCLEDFREHFAISLDNQKRKRKADNSAVRLSLTIADFSVARLCGGERSDVAPLREHLRGMCDYLDFDDELYLAWSPSAEDLKEIEFCALTGQREHARRAVSKSVSKNCFALHEPTGARRNAPPTLATAFQRLLNSLRDVSGNSTPDEHAKLVQNRLETEIFEPLTRRACDSTDPVEKGYYLQLANLNRIVQPQLLKLVVETTSALHQRPQGSVPQYVLDALREMQATSDRLTSLSREQLQRQEKVHNYSKPARAANADCRENR